MELVARAFTHVSRASESDQISDATIQAERISYALPEHFNQDMLRIATVENVVDADEIARLATIASKFELIRGGISGLRFPNEHIRRSNVRWLNRTPDTYWIYARLMEHIVELNDRYWRFDLNFLSAEMQYGEYTESGHYRWHLDLGSGNLSNRKLSCSVQLSDPDEYDGGELELKLGSETIVTPRTQGTLIVFPSFLIHRVAPVTRGVRRSLVGWASGTHPYR